MVDELRSDVGTLPLTCGGVICEPERLTEIEAGRIMVLVDRKDIQHLRLRHGLVSPHPVLQLIAGAVLTALGYFPAAHFIDWFRHGGTFFEAEAYVVPFVIIGLWLGIGTFRRAYILDVATSAGRKRLAFSGSTELAEITRFLDAIEQHYALNVERDVD